MEALQEANEEEPRTVLHGDTLYAFTEVVNKEEAPGDLRGHRNVGLIHFRHWGVNQRGETVFEGERRVLIKKRAFVTEGLEMPEEAVSTVAPKAARNLSAPKRAVTPSNAKTRVSKRARVKARMARPTKPAPGKPRRGGR